MLQPAREAKLTHLGVRKYRRKGVSKGSRGTNHAQPPAPFNSHPVVYMKWMCPPAKNTDINWTAKFAFYGLD